jgi:hypothetical protein
VRSTVVEAFTSSVSEILSGDIEATGGGAWTSAVTDIVTVSLAVSLVVRINEPSNNSATDGANVTVSESVVPGATVEGNPLIVSSGDADSNATSRSAPPGLLYTNVTGYVSFVYVVPYSMLSSAAKIG